MATDATGSPTPLGIPKFNTAADAPSGLGGNAQMDSIDALITARVASPAGIAAGEVPVWNGTTWVRSSVTNITRSTLSGAPLASRQIFGGTIQQTGVSGTYTTPAGVKAIFVEVIAGGGGGGGAAGIAANVGAGGGGGSGGYSNKLIVGPAATYAYVVGGGGNGGAAGNNAGSNGVDSTFGATIVIAKAGAGGGGSTTLGAAGLLGTGAAGGSTTGAAGDLLLPGSFGQNGWALSASQAQQALGGVAPVYGVGTRGAVTFSNAGSAGAGFGGGGQGGLTNSATAQAGGPGAAGLIIVWEYY